MAYRPPPAPEAPAAVTRSSKPARNRRWAAMGGDSVQPVPWGLAPRMRGARIQFTAAVRVTSKSLTTPPAKCPPLSSTADAPMPNNSSAAASIAGSLSSGRPTSKDGVRKQMEAALKKINPDDKILFA